MSFFIDPFRFAAAYSGWTPADLTSPPRWWHNDESTITGSSPVTDWGPVSPATHNLTSSGNKPDLIASSLNGRSVIRFENVTTEWLANNDSAIFQFQPQGWCFLVLKRNADPANLSAARSVLFTSTNPSTSISRFSFFSHVNTNGNAGKPALSVRRLDADSVAILYAATSISSSSHHMYLATMDWSTGAGKIYIDGALDAQNASLTSAGNTSNTGSLSYGRINGLSSGAYDDIDLAELLAGRTIPTSDEIDKLFGYAAHRWGLAALLPALHPYKSAPP